MRSLTLAAVLVLAACVRPSQLSQAASSNSMFVFADETQVTLMLVSYAQAEGGCVVLDEATAEVNGIAMGQQSAGELRPGGCAGAVWTISADQVPAGQLETAFIIKDSSDVWTMSVTNLRAPRTLTRANPKVRLRAGDELVMQWSPATDVAANLSEAGVLLMPDGSYPESSTTPGAGQPVSYQDGAMRFALPSNLAPGTYVFDLSYPPAPARSMCSGPVSCMTDGVFGRPQVTFEVQ